MPERTELLTPAQAGEYLNTGERFVRRLISERRINFHKIGKHVRVSTADLDDYIRRNSIPAVRHG